LRQDAANSEELVLNQDDAPPLHEEQARGSAAESLLTRELLSYLIEQCEARATSAGSAQEALAMLERERERFDLLLSDIGMPEMDGFTLIRRIRQPPAEQGGTIPAIAVTAYARGETAPACSRPGSTATSPSPSSRPSC
jgi:CheY-like chemotaxis protein